MHSMFTLSVTPSGQNPVDLRVPSRQACVQLFGVSSVHRAHYLANSDSLQDVLPGRLRLDVLLRQPTACFWHGFIFERSGGLLTTTKRNSKSLNRLP